MALAVSMGMPCCSEMTRRTLLPAAGWTSPSFRFFTGTPRLSIFDCRMSHTALTRKSSSACRVMVLSAFLKSISMCAPLKS